MFLPGPDHRSTDGKYLQYLTVFTHEITGKTGDLCENGSLTWCVKTLEKLKNNNIPRQVLSAATSSQDCLRISHKLHIKTNDQRLEGSRPAATKPPTLARYFCLSNWATLSETELRGLSQSPLCCRLSLSVSPAADTKYVSGQLQLVLQPLLQL